MNAFALNVRKQLYGTINYDRELFIQAYERHCVRVRSYFSERPNDLLCIDVCNDSPTWDPLCHFLEKSIPDADFPWAHRTLNTDQLLIQLFNHFRDVRLTAQISGVNQDYVENLPRETGGNAPLELDGGRFNATIIARMVSHFGNVETTAAKLNVSAASIDKSVAWVAKDSSRRAAATCSTNT